MNVLKDIQSKKEFLILDTLELSKQSYRDMKKGIYIRILTAENTVHWLCPDGHIETNNTYLNNLYEVLCMD